MRDFVIDGRTRVAEMELRRDAAVRELGRGARGRVNAGNGGQEVRSWLAALGAWGQPVQWTTYEPVPSWITGMGIATWL